MKMIDEWKKLQPVHKVYSFLLLWFAVIGSLNVIDELIWTFLSLGGKG